MSIKTGVKLAYKRIFILIFTSDGHLMLPRRKIRSRRYAVLSSYNKKQKGGGPMKQYFVAIIEDDAGYMRYLEDCLTKYGIEHNCVFQIRAFTQGEAFLADSRIIDDMVFMDVDLGNGRMNGIDTARILREKGNMAVLFFITNMPQYASKGYEVDAIDYCIKPINYHSLVVKLDKAVRTLTQRQGVPIRIKTREGFRVVSSTDILYIEVMGHDLMFHTAQEIICSHGGLGNRERELQDREFARCSASMLVNLRYITGLHGDEITVGGTRLRIGRSRKKDFLLRLNQYLGS